MARRGGGGGGWSCRLVWLLWILCLRGLLDLLVCAMLSVECSVLDVCWVILNKLTFPDDIFLPMGFAVLFFPSLLSVFLRILCPCLSVSVTFLLLLLYFAFNVNVCKCKCKLG